MSAVPPAPIKRIAVEITDAETVIVLVEVGRALRQVTTVGTRTIGASLGGAVADGATSRVDITIDASRALLVLLCH